MKTLTLLKAYDDMNGLKAVQDSFNPAMFNVRKFSKSGRDNGLVARYNSQSGELIQDGFTWRVYKPYNHVSWQTIKDLCVNLITLNQ